MKSLIITTLLSVITVKALAWGKPDLAPASMREKTYSIKTNVDKKTGYSKLNIWTAKNFVNSGETIRLKDQDAGIFIIKGNLPCTALKFGSGYGENQIVDFTLEITVQDKAAELKVTNLIGFSPGSYDGGGRPSNKEEADTAFSQCIDPYVDMIASEFK
jgi:hypothetical protein